jgi:hypothetical protein
MIEGGRERHRPELLRYEVSGETRLIAQRERHRRALATFEYSGMPGQRKSRSGVLRGFIRDVRPGSGQQPSPGLHRTRDIRILPPLYEWLSLRNGTAIPL